MNSTQGNTKREWGAVIRMVERLHPGDPSMVQNAAATKIWTRAEREGGSNETEKKIQGFFGVVADGLGNTISFAAIVGFDFGTSAPTGTSQISKTASSR